MESDEGASVGFVTATNWNWRDILDAWHVENSDGTQGVSESNADVAEEVTGSGHEKSPGHLKWICQTPVDAKTKDFPIGMGLPGSW